MRKSSAKQEGKVQLKGRTRRKNKKRWRKRRK